MGMMAKQTKYIIGFIVLTIFMLVLTPKMVKVEAAEVNKWKIPIKISTVSKDNGLAIEIDEGYEVVLEPENKDNPMPKGSVGDSFSLIIKGAGAAEIPEIMFESIGVYKYKIFQKANNNKLISYDDSVYDLIVYVTNKGNGNGLETTTRLYLVGNDEKYDEVVFKNSYEREKLPDTGGKEIPKEKEELPKTGDNIKSMTFYGAGIFIVLLGLVLGKRKENNKL